MREFSSSLYPVYELLPSRRIYESNRSRHIKVITSGIGVAGIRGCVSRQQVLLTGRR